MSSHSSLETFGIEGIYVVHAKKGYELHEERINTIFGGLGMKFEFVTDGDPSLFTPGLLKEYFIDDIQQKLRPGVLSCTLNHILSYKKIVERKNKYALVFENDPFFTGDFIQQVIAVAKEADTLPGGFIISIENTELRFPPFRSIRKNKLLYPAKSGRCAGAYLIDLKGAEDILKDLQTTKCHTVIDWWHNSMIDRNVIQMYWAYPAFVEQGSHNGLLNSTISTKSKSTKRRIQWLFQKYYNTYITRWFK